MATGMATEMATANSRKHPEREEGDPERASHLRLCEEWAGADLNHRSLRGRFTVCSLWPLGHRPRDLGG